MQETKEKKIIYKFLGKEGDEQRSYFVELNPNALTKEQLKDRVIKMVYAYRETNPREYNISEFLLYLRRNGIPAEEFEAEEEMYF